MTYDYKKGVLKALENNYKRNFEPKTTRKNEAPEKLVESECLDWLEQIGASMDIYDSKAVWSQQYGGYLSQKVIEGHSDLGGNFIDGMAAWIELKAKGKRYNVSLEQWDFLHDKIKTNAFACVTDSRSHLQSLHRRWTECDLMKRRELLLADLPKRPEKKSDNKPLFDPE